MGEPPLPGCAGPACGLQGRFAEGGARPGQNRLLEGKPLLLGSSEPGSNGSSSGASDLLQTQPPFRWRDLESGVRARTWRAPREGSTWRGTFRMFRGGHLPAPPPPPRRRPRPMSPELACPACTARPGGQSLPPRSPSSPSPSPATVPSSPPVGDHCSKTNSPEPPRAGVPPAQRGP